MENKELVEKDGQKNFTYQKSSVYGPFEYSELKLLLNSDKCKNILNVASKELPWDNTFPISVELHLTNRCNLECEWCIDKNIRKNLEDIPFHTLLNLLDDIEKHQAGITIEGGGEPTLYKYFNEFVQAASKKKIDLGLITNGVTMFDVSLVKEFKWIRVSVDAASKEEYLEEKGGDQYETVLKNIENMCRNKGNCFIGISYVLTKRNYSNMIQLLYKMEEFGVNYVRIRAVEEKADLLISKEELINLEEKIQKNFSHSNMKVILNKSLGCDNNTNLPCVAHSLRAIIHADGQVMMCEKRRHDPITLGNINSNSFSEIWFSQKRMKNSQKLLNPDNQIGCTTCRITKYNKIFSELIHTRTNHFI